MSQKVPVNDLKWIAETLQFNKDFIKRYNDDSDEGDNFEAGVHYPDNIHRLHNNLPFLPERIKIGQVEILVPNLHDKKVCCTDKKLKTSIKSWINTEKSA